MNGYYIIKNICLERDIQMILGCRYIMKDWTIKITKIISIDIEWKCCHIYLCLSSTDMVSKKIQGNYCAGTFNYSKLVSESVIQ